MNKKITFFISLAMLSFCFFTQSVFADTSTNYASHPKLAWSALECAALSSFAKKTQTESERLFNLGYKKAKEFSIAVKENKVNADNLDRGEIPLFYRFYVGAYPSIDFNVGRMHEFIVGQIHDKVSEKIIDKTRLADEKLRQTIASGIFWEKNCQLIGLD